MTDIVERRDTLERDMRCADCLWNGKLGKVIAADVLRCPRCRSENIGYSVPETSETKQ